MALDIDQLSAITENKFIPKMVDNIFDSLPTLKKFKEGKDSVDGGVNIREPLNYAQITASGEYQGSDTLDTNDNDTFTAAQYSWKQYYANITISRRQRLQNSGAPAVLSLVRNKVKVAEKSLMDKLATGIFHDGSVAKRLIGLRSIVATGNTVGGISQTDNSWWRSNVDTTTTTLTLAALGTQYTAASIGSDKPDFMVTTRTIWDLYHNLLQPQERFMDKKQADAGFSSLLFRGTPIVHDSYCPSGDLYGLNTDYISLKVHREEDMRFVPFVSPWNQNVEIAKIYWMGALTASNNRMHFLLSSITG